MTDPPQDWTESNEPEAEAVAEEDYYLAPELISEVSEALAAGEVNKVQELIEPLHAADLADLLEYLDKDERVLAVEAL